MEDFGDTREETFDELVTKHTRRELEELALKYGVENLGGTKSQLADAILEAIKKQKDQPKAAVQPRPKEAPMVEKPKPTAKPVGIGKKGVMAKSAAINSKATEIREQGIRVSKEMQTEARKMIEDGQQRFQLGQAEFRRSLDAQMKENQEAEAKFRRSLDAQMKENQEAEAKFNSGVRAIRSSQETMSRDFQNGLNRFRSDLDAQIKENREAISRLNSGARELHNEIQRYQEQNLKSYIRDFYYG